MNLATSSLMQAYYVRNNNKSPPPPPPPKDTITELALIDCQLRAFFFAISQYVN